MYNTQEEWRPVPGWEGLYDVSSTGEVRSLDRVICYIDRGREVRRTKKGLILQPARLPAGYLQVNLTDGERREKHSVHCLVAYAFLGPRPDGLSVCHNDGSTDQNNAGNLRYDTPAANSADRYRHGTVVAGDRHHWTKLSEFEARVIYDLGQLGKSASRVHRLFPQVTKEAIAWTIKGNRVQFIDGIPQPPSLPPTDQKGSG